MGESIVGMLLSLSRARHYRRERERDLAEREVAAKERIAAALEKDAASHLDNAAP
jgi:hypothetical protein